MGMQYYRITREAVPRASQRSGSTHKAEEQRGVAFAPTAAQVTIGSYEDRPFDGAPPQADLGIPAGDHRRTGRNGARIIC